MLTQTLGVSFKSASLPGKPRAQPISHVAWLSHSKPASVCWHEQLQTNKQWYLGGYWILLNKHNSLLLHGRKRNISVSQNCFSGFLFSVFCLQDTQGVLWSLWWVGGLAWSCFLRWESPSAKPNLLILYTISLFRSNVRLLSELLLDTWPPENFPAGHVMKGCWELQRDNLWFSFSDSPLLQSVEPRDVLMDVQGWGSRETRGHLRGGRRGSQRDLQVSDQESSYHQHRSRPWINSPLLIRCPNIHYICHTCPAWLG